MEQRQRKGLRAPNGFSVVFNWNNGKLTGAIITSMGGKDCLVQLPKGLNVYTIRGQKVSIEKSADGVVKFATKKGEQFRLQ